MRPSRPPPPKTTPQKWVPPPKKRKTQVVKKSVSREREYSKSVYRLAHPKGWLRDEEKPKKTNRRADGHDTHDEVEQQDGEDSGSLEDKHVGKVEEDLSASPPRQMAPALTERDPDFEEEEEEKMCNTKLKLCTNINTTDISDVTENAHSAATSPLSNKFCRNVKEVLTIKKLCKLLLHY